MIYIQVKAMGGINYVRAKDILGVLFTEREKCNILMIGGVTVPCYEPAAAVVARIEEQMKGAQAPAEATPDGKEPRDGDGSA
jgi:hypothetical protein